jgi:hypothetical protein
MFTNRAQTEKDREEEGLCQQWSNVQKDDNGNAVLKAKIYCTFVCFVELFQNILMNGGQRLKLKDTIREGAIASKTAQFSCPDKYSQEWIKLSEEVMIGCQKNIPRNALSILVDI